MTLCLFTTVFLSFGCYLMLVKINIEKSYNNWYHFEQGKDIRKMEPDLLEGYSISREVQQASGTLLTYKKTIRSLNMPISWEVDLKNHIVVDKRVIKK